jgi:hypothetical protein
MKKRMKKITKSKQKHLAKTYKKHLAKTYKKHKKHLAKTYRKKHLRKTYKKHNFFLQKGGVDNMQVALQSALNQEADDLAFGGPWDYIRKKNTQELDKMLRRGGVTDMIKTKTKDGMTLLHAAAIVGSPEITRLLLDYGIDPHEQMRVSINGEESILSASQIARMLNNNEVAGLIEQDIAAAIQAVDMDIDEDL